MDEELDGPVGPDEPPVVRRSPAAVVAPYLLTGLVLALVLRYRAALLDNSDTWFHLSLGERFRGDWSPAHPGALTPFASSDWVATQWSTEVVAGWFEGWFGLPGVAWLLSASGAERRTRSFGEPTRYVAALSGSDR